MVDHSHVSYRGGMTGNHITRKRGVGLVNKIINALPFELHLPGYQYCGPGTRLTKRLARGDRGINPLDAACKQHDIAYSKNREDVEARNVADRILAQKAWERVRADDSTLSERAAAFLVSNIMKVKNKFGMGMSMCSRKKSTKNVKPPKGKGLRKTKKKKRTQQNKIKNMRKKSKLTLKRIMNATSKTSIPNNNSITVIRSAIKGAREAIKKSGGKRNLIIPRIIPVPPTTGGALPLLIPLFAGLSAMGALAGGTAGVVKAINSVKTAENQLKEAQRHNKTMEAIAIGKGLNLKPYKKGYGIFLKPYKSGAGLKKKRS